MINSYEITKGRIIRFTEKKKSKRDHVLSNGSSPLCVKHTMGQHL